MVRITGTWNKLPPKTYENTYYALENSIQTIQKIHHSNGFMRRANYKFSTLQEALKSGIAIAKRTEDREWVDKIILTKKHTAYIYKGDECIGVVQYPEVRGWPYEAIYTAKNGKKMYLNKDGSEYKGQIPSKPKTTTTKPTFVAQVVIDRFQKGPSKNRYEITATSYQELRKKLSEEFSYLRPVDWIHVYVDGKQVATVQPVSGLYHLWWGINETSRKFNPRTGKFIHKE